MERYKANENDIVQHMDVEYALLRRQPLVHSLLQVRPLLFSPVIKKLVWTKTESEW